MLYLYSSVVMCMCTVPILFSLFIVLLYVSFQDGVWVTGLYLEGAGWDKRTSCLVEANPMQLVCPMPAIHFKPNENKRRSAKGKIKVYINLVTCMFQFVNACLTQCKCKLYRKWNMYITIVGFWCMHVWASHN